MQIFIMRHGQAFTSGSPDALRGLTEQGKLEASVMTKWLKNTNADIQQILISPFIRAQETAKQVVDGFSNNVVATTLDFITPSGSARELHDYIDGVCVGDKIETLLIVSHMPLVSYLVAELTVDNEAPIFQTAAIAEIDYDIKRMKGFLVKLTAPSDLC